jgi:NitT/TauT family transport system substrate-binding protein
MSKSKHYLTKGNTMLTKKSRPKIGSVLAIIALVFASFQLIPSANSASNVVKIGQRCSVEGKWIGTLICSNSGAGFAWALGVKKGAAVDKINFATVPIAGTAAVYVGNTAGYFKNANIDISIVNATSFANIVPLVVNGSNQFGTVSLATAAAAIIQGLPIKIVANTYFFNGEQQLMSLTSGKVKTVSDLSGKTIGLGALNNNFQAGIITQMKTAKVDLSTVKFVLLPAGNLAAALRAGTVDAAQINEPDIAGAGDTFTAIMSQPFQPFGLHAANNYVIVNTIWAAKNKKLVDRFVSAYNLGADRAASDLEAVVAAVSSYSTIPAETLREMNMPGFGSALQKGSYTQTISKMFALGYLSRNVSWKEAFYY